MKKLSINIEVSNEKEYKSISNIIGSKQRQGHDCADSGSDCGQAEHGCVLPFHDEGKRVGADVPHFSRGQPLFCLGDYGRGQATTWLSF